MMKLYAFRADGTRSVPATIFLAFALLATPVFAQSYPERVPPVAPNPQAGANPAATPDQPVQPRVPRLIPRVPEQVAPQPPPGQQQPPQPPQPPPAPFQLSPEEQTHVDGVLTEWEKRNHDIKRFDCRFKRWIYDVVFGPADKPKFVETGVIKFATPDKGLFRLETSEKDGKESPIDNARAEHWICDGKAVWEYSPAKKQVIEHKLPPEMQGKAIANSPLPFLFGAEAKNLKQRYFIRIVTPADVQNQIWLEAYPRYQQDAANFHHSIFIINTQGMTPFALRIVQPNAKDYTVYQFYDVVLNDSWNIFKGGDPFKPFTPWGWQTIPDTAPQPAANGAK